MALPSTSAGGTERSRVSRCVQCAAHLAHDQRYCVECGARRGPLPPSVAELIGVAPLDASDPPQSREREPGGSRVTCLAERWLSALGETATPSPQATAVAVMALLAFGVLVGSAVSPVQDSGAAAPIVVAVSSPSAAKPSPSAASVAPPSTTPEATPSEASSEPPTTTPAETTPSATAPQSTEKQARPERGSTTPTLPPITHVFLIVLSDQGFSAAFGAKSQATYLSKTLTGQGELLGDYHAVTGGELANEIALISGQGPTPQTAANCPMYTDIAPGTVGPQGQVLGGGCVYPRQTLTLADQLSAEGRTSKAYVEGIGNGGVGQPTTCRHPTLGQVDPNQAPSLEDPYVSWRDPFVYFHSVIDNTTCTSTVVGLDRLAPDLATASKAPSLAYIVPDRCHDGSDEPCAPGQPAGLAAADAFLRTVVPQIESSPAYRAGGMIAITFDQAPQSGPSADSSGCCLTAAYPNLPAATAGTTGEAGSPAGGGRVGLLLISKYVKPGSLNVTGEYNHFSLLASIEDLFGLSHLGYAGTQGLPVFDASVYNAKK